MNYLLLGTILDHSAFTSDLAANPASTKWLSGFVGGLHDNGDKVSLCGHCYARAWPRGALFPGKREYLDHNYDNHLVRFINVPGVRYGSMGRGYYRSGCVASQDCNPDLIVTYNPYPWHVSAARRLRRKLNIPWVCLNLDFDEVGEDWKCFLRVAGDADAHLFLSHWGYLNAPVENKINLDSGVSHLAPEFGANSNRETINLVYLGSLSDSAGLKVLLALPDLIQNENVRFIYGGKGYPEVNSRLLDLEKSDSRVDFRGFVDDREMKALFDQADIFLNPRDPMQVINDMVFPSKIMHYLQTGKTVVSTWTRGLEECYRDLMIIAEEPSVEDYSKAVSRAISESHQDRTLRANLIKDFLLESRLWSKQAERFSDFCKVISR
ncbi:MAG TPA: hypothetical protein DCX14_01640 [Flavobacteriales bacterium]|nr:hypothetical protein [Flavobacteriales bacterium]